MHFLSCIFLHFLRVLSHKKISLHISSNVYDPVRVLAVIVDSYELSRLLSNILDSLSSYGLYYV